MQLNELIRNIERDGLLLIKDYIVDDLDVNEVYKTIQKLSQKELLSLEVIAKTIGHSDESLGDTFLYPKGYRILRKVPRIPASVIENLIEHFNDFNSVVKASLEDLDKVDGIGEARATAIRNGLKRIKEQVSLNKEL